MANAMFLILQIHVGLLGMCMFTTLKDERNNSSSDYSGVFLCIRCSGIHRGMGTHISKVKSIDLDSWTPEQMEVLFRTF